jgi:hypothetical protein
VLAILATLQLIGCVRHVVMTDPTTQPGAAYDCAIGESPGNCRAATDLEAGDATPGGSTYIALPAACGGRYASVVVRGATAEVACRAGERAGVARVASGPTLADPRLPVFSCTDAEGPGNCRAAGGLIPLPTQCQGRYHSFLVTAPRSAAPTVRVRCAPGENPL